MAVRGSADLAMADGGRTLYLATELGLEVFARDAETGRLDRVQSAAQGIDLSRAALAWDAARGRVLADDCGAWREFRPLRDGADDGRLAGGIDLVAEDDPYTCGDALLSQADGAFAYRIGPGRVDVFELAAGPAGAPRFAQTLEAPGLSSAALNGDRLYALADDGLLVFERDAATGLLAASGDPVPLDAPATALAVAADGRAYVVEANGVGMFDLADPLRPRRAGAPFPTAPRGGGCRFAAAIASADVVHVFCRRAAFGAHWPRGAEAEIWTADAVAELPAFSSPVAVATSPDSRHVYVATPASGVLIFARGGASQAAAPATEPPRHAGPAARRPAAAYLPGPVPGVPRRRGYRPLDETGPDLRVADPTVVRTSFAGRQFRMRVRVRNVADPVGEEPTLSFHRSEDDDEISTSDPVVGTTVVDDVDFDGEWYESDFQNPDSGAYYGACVAAVAGELDTTNNCSVGVFVAMGAPDLAVTVAAGEAAPGEPFELTATVRNDGADRSPSANLVFLSSPDDAIGLFDARLGSATVGPLASGAAVDETIKVTAPSSASTHYYGACVAVSVGRDADGTNNCAAGVAVTVPEPVGAAGATSGFRLASGGRYSGIAYWGNSLYAIRSGPIHNWDGGKVEVYGADGARLADLDFVLDGDNEDPTGIAHADGAFYVADWSDVKVYAYAADGARRADLDFDLDGGNGDPTGIAHADAAFYVADEYDDKVYAYGFDGARRADLDFDLDGDNSPAGIAHADAAFYVADEYDDKVYAYGFDGARRADLDFVLDGDNGYPAGIAHADGAFYVADEYDEKVYAYGFDGARRADLDFVLDGDNGDPTGIAHADGAFYVADEYDDKVYAYGFDGARRADLDFDLDGDNGYPAGIAHADGAFYVADGGGGIIFARPKDGTADDQYDKVYAYGFDGARRADLDFDLDGYNGAPAGIAHADGAFYVADWYFYKVFAYAADGARRGDLDFDLDGDNLYPRGIAHADGALYVADWYNEKVYAYGFDGARRTDLDFDLDGDNSPAGIAHADGAFYVADEYDDKVYAYGAFATVRGDFDLDGENGHPDGIAHADAAFYVADRYDDKVYAYAADGARRTDLDFVLDGDNGDPAGIAHADGAFYVADDQYDKVYAYGFDGARRADLDFVLDGDNGDPTGIAHADGAFYVADEYDEKVYAYGFDGARRADLDFVLDGDSGDPTGIAHADGAFYVADRGSDKVYAYAAGGARRPDLDFDLYPRNSYARRITAQDGTLYVVDYFDARVYAYPLSGR